MMTVDWTLAACRGEGDPEIFFPLGGWDSMTNLALSICASCPIRAACGDFALTTGQVDGIWGGMTEDQRRARRAALNTERRIA